MPNTQKEITVRSDRPLSNNSQVVEAHGVTPDYVKESDFDGHLDGGVEHKGEPVKRIAKASAATAGRHITSGKDGLEVAKERSASIQANRKASAACFNSKKLTVCPEQKGRKRQ